MPGEVVRRELGVPYRRRKSRGPAARGFIEGMKGTVPSDPAIEKLSA